MAPKKPRYRPKLKQLNLFTSTPSLITKDIMKRASLVQPNGRTLVEEQRHHENS